MKKTRSLPGSEWGRGLNRMRQSHLDADGSPVDVLLTISPIRNLNGKMMGPQKSTATTQGKRKPRKPFAKARSASATWSNRRPPLSPCSTATCALWPAVGIELEDYCPDAVSIVSSTRYEVFPEIPERSKRPHRRGLAGEVVRVDEGPFLRADGRSAVAALGTAPSADERSSHRRHHDLQRGGD